MESENINKINGCCKPFSPTSFQDKEIIWIDKPFIKDSVVSFCHVPLNMGSVIKKNQSKIKQSENSHDYNLILSDEKSL